MSTNDETPVNQAEEVPQEVENDENDVGGLDEEVFKLKSHKRAASDTPAKPPKERRRMRKEPSPEPLPTNDEVQLEEEENLAPEERDRRALEAKLDAALVPASRRRKKLTADDIEMLQDDMIAKLRDEMRKVALEDVECVQQQIPAINKVKLLPQVVKTLQKANLADSILDGNLLESVRIWLEPLPDASLPSFEIQKALFEALTTLPIKTIHLRESGLGRVVMFYTRSKRPLPLIKRLAHKLMGDWTRPIIGRSDNYRDKMVETVDFDPNQESALKRSQAPEEPNRRNRAAIPVQMGLSYNVAPVSSVTTGELQSKDSQLRRMKTKLMANKARGKKSQVSVEGKGLH